ncbi:hypothetical protein [Bacteroides acidifaciens]|uniref:hypothetical protein n=1 Tax=Bacteroides acidifaciens TaxID=85831 RepID=UPI00259892F6|nr:hypothetical protein [Bacteroides acidifaciens]
MSKKKEITINTRVDESIHRQMREKAATYFKGNMSALIRCATLRYTEEATTVEPTGTNPQLIALISTVIKKIDKTVSIIIRPSSASMKKMKMSPLAFNANDLLPFNQFGSDMKIIQDMLRHLYEMLKS